MFYYYDEYIATEETYADWFSEHYSEGDIELEDYLDEVYDREEKSKFGIID